MLQELIHACTTYEAAERPSIADVLARLQALLETLN